MRVASDRLRPRRPCRPAERELKIAALAGIHVDLTSTSSSPTPAPTVGAPRRGRHGAAPARSTPAKNPYNPSFETGAVDFVRRHPKADGRGITIGILDSGVDLGHPALQKTTTGERKIVDWVTATDPIVDGDAHLARRWSTAVVRPDASPTAGAHLDGARPARTRSAASARPPPRAATPRATSTATATPPTPGACSTTPAAGTVRVDLDDDGDFTDDAADEAVQGQATRSATSARTTRRPTSPSSIPFVVEIRKDVPMDPYGGDWVGKKADFVNIGIIEAEHGTHVAGITAANGLFGGKMNGAAPGAKIVSSRACTWSGGCTNVALTEGMIDLVVNRGVDVVNMSIGGLPALNDGNNARAELYNRLIDTYGVQLVISAGNERPRRQHHRRPAASPTRSSRSARRSPRRPGPPTTAPRSTQDVRDAALLLARPA